MATMSDTTAALERQLAEIRLRLDAMRDPLMDLAGRFVEHGHADPDAVDLVLLPEEQRTVVMLSVLLASVTVYLDDGEARRRIAESN